GADLGGGEVLVVEGDGEGQRDLRHAVIGVVAGVRAAGDDGRPGRRRQVVVGAAAADGGGDGRSDGRGPGAGGRRRGARQRRRRRALDQRHVVAVDILLR